MDWDTVSPMPAIGPMRALRSEVISSGVISAPLARFSSIAAVMPLMMVPIQDGSVL